MLVEARATLHRSARSRQEKGSRPLYSPPLFSLRNQIEGNVIQAISRTLKEEVKFDRAMVTSLDWSGYPILRFTEIPEVVIELINHPDQPALGAGEPANSAIPAAIANALFNATGVRLRTVPFTPERVKAALA